MRRAQNIVREILELAVEQANKEPLLSWRRYIERVAAIYNELAPLTITAAQAEARIKEWGLKTTVPRPHRKRRNGEATNLIRNMLEQFKSGNLDSMSVTIGHLICTVSRKQEMQDPPNGPAADGQI